LRTSLSWQQKAQYLAIAAQIFAIGLALAAFLLPTSVEDLHRQHTQTIAASYDEPDSFEGPVASIDIHSIIYTYINIEPVQSVIYPDSVILKMEILQRQCVYSSQKKECISGDILDSVENEIRMSVESSDFDFATGGNDRKYGKGATLPTVAVWTPSPKKAGSLHLNVRFKNISKLHLTVGGKDEPTTGTGDIPITVYVSETSGFSPTQQQYFLWACSGLAFLVTLILQLISVFRRPRTA
jgi:hypothetical protein